MITTKEQERQALQKIRKIVDGLGNDSYIAMAFEGCFEIAEENIDNDFGCSMKQQRDSAIEKSEKALLRVGELERQLDEMQSTLESAEKTLDAMRKRVPEKEDVASVIRIIHEKIAGLDAEIKNAEERIVQLADTPDDAQFKNAVKDHRAARKEEESFRNLERRMHEVYSK